MAYRFVLTKSAAKDLRGIGPDIAKRIIRKLVWFEAQSNPLAFAKRLRDHATGDIRFRVGDYRLIAVVNAIQNRIEIVQIGHRREVYL